MKKFRFFTLIASVLMLAACNTSEEPNDLVTRDIVVPDANQLTQTVNADQTQGLSGVTFTTTGAWNSTITETRGDVPTWISITPDRGSAAGDYTIQITLEKNTTGADRKAVITILCGESEVPITVEQKKAVQGGDQSKKIVKIHRMRETRDVGELELQYDNQGRVVKHMIVMDGVQQEYTMMTYSETKITCETYEVGEAPYTEIFMLDNNGRVVSSRVGEDDYDSNTWRYDAQGYLSYWAESFDIKAGESGTTTTEIGSDESTYTWENGNMSKIQLQYYSSTNNKNIVNYTFEYSPMLTEKMNLDICALFMDATPIGLLGLQGKRSKNLVSKQVVSDDIWNKDNGVSTFRYEIDGEGYVTDVYSTWTQEGGSPDAEIHAFHLEYK